MPFIFRPLSIAGPTVIESEVFVDDRGFFAESYVKSVFERQGIAAEFVQDNHSRSSRGVLRGLHYQIQPHAQGKLVSVVNGRIWDVAVDLRRRSDTCGQWVAVELSASAKNALWIPPGFAHGFVCLSETADVFYKTTAEYDRASERGIRWDDSALAIDWPTQDVVVSDRDAALPTWAEVDLFV